MIKLSTRSTYGMRALVELALNSSHGPVSAAQIAQRQNLSVAYLEQLLHRLKRSGLVKSVRGPRGGFALARPAHRINMADVVRILEGNSALAEARQNGKRPVPSGAHSSSAVQIQRHGQRVAQAVWHCVHERLMESLHAVTLQDLWDSLRSQPGEPIEHRYVFHI
ncbi:MAG: Rrf2 family transcriptional regulator [Candidatus Omnitrophica bacterium]|nr:Rrf2 family transcriptional regulator [Candidatus Omnitrophota bacterium]MBI2174166.1 Rrf2 family transcriptional regulator [Candidatus Omnitrophota bacterium]MBI3010189.1 Rrf2 family transcriptional regulator [Candidatus Omnitrophota bacterium]